MTRKETSKISSATSKAKTSRFKMHSRSLSSRTTSSCRMSRIQKSQCRLKKMWTRTARGKKVRLWSRPSKNNVRTMAPIPRVTTKKMDWLQEARPKSARWRACEKLWLKKTSRSRLSRLKLISLRTISKSIGLSDWNRLRPCYLNGQTNEILNLKCQLKFQLIVAVKSI